MDKNTWIGFLLIAAIIVGFSLLNRPSKAELAERQRVQDSIAFARAEQEAAQQLTNDLAAQITTPQEQTTTQEQQTSQEELQARVQAAYGTFAPAAQGTEQWVKLENEHLRLTLSTHGGVIQRAELLDYHAAGDSVNPLCLFRGEEANLAFTLITANNRILQTSNLYFTPVATDEPNRAILRLPTAAEDAYIDFIYDISDSYMVHLSIAPHNMQTELAQNVNSMEIHWRQLIPQQE